MESNDKKVEVFDDEKAILLSHDYDGIRELNHPLPSWWVTIFVLSIVFSIPYYIYYTHMNGPSSDETLNAEIAQIEKQQAEFQKNQEKFDLEKYNAYVATKKAQKIGKKTFKRKCKACHGAQGEGSIGPNLADNYWIHGDGSIESVYNTIDHGVVDKGMPAWGQTLGKEKVMAVVDYVMKFKGTNPANAKAPQGKLYQ